MVHSAVVSGATKTQSNEANWPWTEIQRLLPIQPFSFSRWLFWVFCLKDRKLTNQTNLAFVLRLDLYWQGGKRAEMALGKGVDWRSVFWVWILVQLWNSPLSARRDKGGMYKIFCSQYESSEGGDNCFPGTITHLNGCFINQNMSLLCPPETGCWDAFSFKAVKSLQ